MAWRWIRVDHSIDPTLARLVLSIDIGALLLCDDSHGNRDRDDSSGDTQRERRLDAMIDMAVLCCAVLAALL